MTDVWRAIWSRDGDYLVRVETLRSTARDLHATIARLTRERDALAVAMDDARGTLVRLERELSEAREAQLVPVQWVPGFEDADEHCTECGASVTDPHTWKDCLAAVRGQHAQVEDFEKEERARLELELKAASRLSTLIVVRVCNALAPGDVRDGDEVEDAVRRVRVQRDRLRAIVVKEGLCCEGMALGKQTHSPDCLEAQALGEEPK